MVDKAYCCSAFLAFRFIPRDGVEFAPGLRHINATLPKKEDCTPVACAADIDAALQGAFDNLAGQRLGLLLSGGMDSATLASYMKGCDAYTFRFLGGNFQREELQRAERFAAINDMTLHYVDIDWSVVQEGLEPVMRHRGAPVHSIEPQIFAAARQAAADGIERMIIGDGADYVFGGMNLLLAKDWGYEEFIRRYIYIDPADVLVEPAPVTGLFEPYRRGDKIDFMSFMDGPNTQESYGSYMNAFATASMPYSDPYEHLSLAEPLDLNRIRGGESKYLVRELFRMRYGEKEPEKVPMPRPVDEYFRSWNGPKRGEFRRDIDLGRYNGNQRWLMYALERFLNMIEDER